MTRPSTIVISDWISNCQAGQWTPFEAATALIAALAKDGYTIVPASPEAAEIAIARKLVCEKCSVSYMQRKMMTTYNHACRLMSALEAEGTVSTPSAAGVRVVLRWPQEITGERQDG